MILYFSGTGNSAYVANEIGKSLSDNVLNLHQKIADSDFSFYICQNKKVLYNGEMHHLRKMCQNVSAQ